MLIEGGMVPLTRAIYNRNSTANVFAFLASATAELSHHAVRGGNSRLVQALFKVRITGSWQTFSQKQQQSNNHPTTTRPHTLGTAFLIFQGALYHTLPQRRPSTLARR